MATRVFSDEELARFRAFPEITDAGPIRFFTLTPQDMEFIDPGRGRSPANRLAMAVQLCTLPWLGFVPDDVTSAPPAAVARLSARLGIPVGELRGYGARSHTRTDHLVSVAKYWGWKQPKDLEYKELDELRGLEVIARGRVILLSNSSIGLLHGLPLRYARGKGPFSSSRRAVSTGSVTTTSGNPNGARPCRRACR